MSLPTARVKNVWPLPPIKELSFIHPCGSIDWGGTVLQYIIDYLAANLGFASREADITLHDLRAGKYAGLALVGNAVKVTPLRQLNLYRNNTLHEQIELFAKGHVPERLELLRQRWEDETRGLIDPSHSSLLTPVPLP